jgi:hypothetical protein
MSLRVLGERKKWHADWLTEDCLNAWGDRFRDAAADYQPRASTFGDFIGYKQDQAVLSIPEQKGQFTGGIAANGSVLARALARVLPT